MAGVVEGVGVALGLTSILGDVGNMGEAALIEVAVGSGVKTTVGKGVDEAVDTACLLGATDEVGVAVAAAWVMVGSRVV